MKTTKHTVMKQRPYFQSWRQSLVGLCTKGFFFFPKHQKYEQAKILMNWFLKAEKFG